MSTERNIRRMQAIKGKEHKIKLLTRTKQALEDAQIRFGHTKYLERIANLEKKIQRLQEDNKNTQINLDKELETKEVNIEEFSLESKESEDFGIKLEI